MSLVKTLELPVVTLWKNERTLCFSTPDRNIISTYNCEAEKRRGKQKLSTLVDSSLR